MKRTIGIMAAAAIGLVAAGAFGKAFGKTSWEAKGKYYETCGCAVSCPCATGEFLPTESHCDAVGFLHLDKASVGKTKLDGLNLAFVLKSPKNRKVNEAFEKGEMDHWAIYIDDKATDEQKAAIPQLMEGLFGKMEIKGAKPPAFVAIKLDTSDEGATIDIASGKLTADLVNLKIGEEKKGGKMVPKRVRIEGGTPFPWIPVVTQGKSKSFHYADGSVKWDYKDRNAFFGDFATKGTLTAAAEPTKK
jgi:hypothetical protein